jgi:putative transposase
MTSPNLPSVFHLYQKIVCDGVLDHVQELEQREFRQRIYNLPVVIWLMMLQRLTCGSLASAVQEVINGSVEPLLGGRGRSKRHNVSCRTGGYSRARKRLPSVLCERVAHDIVERLRQVLNTGESGGQQNIFLLDGSSLELEHCPELLRCYPAATNQHGRSHWPVLRIVVMHDAGTGLAQRPYWGPMYGPKAVSEQALAETAIQALPKDSTMIADRNFGVFSIAYSATQNNIGVILRLTEVRAQKLAGGPIAQPGEYDVEWKSTRWDGRNGDRCCWPDGASIPGRLIAARVGQGKSQQWLYLFTTIAGSAEEIVGTYARRWSIETDLRSLKRTVGMHHIHAKTPEIMEKELLIATSAYNLVRAVICLATRRQRLDPRRISFTHALNVVNAAWPKLVNARTQAEHQQQFDLILDRVLQGILPKRREHRSYPRELWRRGGESRYRKAEPK